MRLSDKLSDAVNPIVVKELRQAVQGKFVTATLFFLLLIQLGAIAVYVLTRDDLREDFRAGRDMFMILHGILLTVALVFVPAYSAIRLAAERSDANVDLLFISTIRPVSIIGGKLFCALVLSFLIFTACLPFITFTYFLRGLDLPSMFAALALDFFVVLAYGQLGIVTACLPTNRVLKAIAGIILLGSLPFAFAYTMFASYGILSAGVGGRLGTWDFWRTVGAFAAVYVPIIATLFAISVAFVSPPSSNRALPVRACISAAWLLTGVGMAAISHFDGSGEPVSAWIVFQTLLLSTALFVAVSEREELGRRVRRAIPTRLALRLPAFFLFSGAASGLSWVLLLLAGTFAFGGAWFSAEFRNAEKTLSLSGFALSVACYCLTALSLRRRLPAVKPGQTWIIALTLLSLGATLPLFGAYLLDAFSKPGLWLLGNPFLFFSGRDEIKASWEVHFTFLIVWLAVVCIFNVGWFRRQAAAFTPLPPIRQDS
jgi:hypothetical protein